MMHQRIGSAAPAKPINSRKNIMKTFFAVAAFGLIAAAQAQEQCAASVAAIPSCAVSCIASAGSQASCERTDLACQCDPTKSAAIASAALGCVVSACGPVTGLAVQTAASAVCDCVATAAPASTTVSSSSSQVSTTPSATASQTSSVQLPTKPYPTVSAGTTPAPSGSTPSASGGAGSGSASVTPFTGGAPLVAGSISGIVGALFFVMLLLDLVDPKLPEFPDSTAKVLSLSLNAMDAFDLYHQVHEVERSRAFLDGPALPALGHATAGSTGAAVSNLVTYPLALIVTRLQIQRSLSDGFSGQAEEGYRSLQDAVTKIYKREGGLAGFYVGVIPDTVKTIADAFLFFLAYNYLRQARLRARAAASKYLPIADELIVGFVAGAFAKFFTTPIANVVTRQQAASILSRSQPPGSKDSSIQATASRIRSQKGLQGFWCGYSASLVLTLNPSLTFFLFETLKRLLIPRRKRSNPPPQATFLIAAISKAIASTITYPFSLAKSRAQTSSKSVNEKDTEKNNTAEKVQRHTASAAESARAKAPSNVFTTILQISRAEGLSALYEGLGGEVLKGFFSHGLTMIVKQAVHRFIIQLYYLSLRLLKRFPTPETAVQQARERSKQAVVAVQKGTQPLATAASMKLQGLSEPSLEQSDSFVEALRKNAGSTVGAIKRGAQSRAKETRDCLQTVSERLSTIGKEDEG
ncbi:MAG: hypothetical protein Q9181_002574 [Wetmoreana brouardii]